MSESSSEQTVGECLHIFEVLQKECANALSELQLTGTRVRIHLQSIAATADETEPPIYIVLHVESNAAWNHLEALCLRVETWWARHFPKSPEAPIWRFRRYS